MASLEVTEKSLFRAVRDQVRSDHGLLIDRSDSLDDGPFLIKSPDGDKVILKGMTLQQLAGLGHFDLTQFTVVRPRRISIQKTWPAQWPPSGDEDSTQAVNQRVPS